MGFGNLSEWESLDNFRGRRLVIVLRIMVKIT